MGQPGTGSGWETPGSSITPTSGTITSAGGGNVATGSGWETPGSAVAAVSPPSQGGGGGGIGGFLGKLGSNLVSAAEHAPGGALAIGKAIGHDIVNPLIHPGPHSGGETFGIASAAAKQTRADLSHPLRNPGYTALDALGLLSGGAGAAARLGAAGRALSAADEAGMLERLSNAGKALATKPAPVTRLISHDGITVKLPAADNPLTRTIQHGIDTLRQAHPNVPLIGAARMVGKEIQRGLRYEGMRAKAPIDTMNALAGKAGMLKRTATGRLTGDALARQHALRVVAEGVPTEERIAYHQGALTKGYSSAATNPAIRAMRESTFTSGHEEQIGLNRAAQKYLDESGAKPKLADPKLHAVYDQMRKVAGNREEIIGQLGKLKDETMAGRLDRPGQLLTGREDFTGGQVRVPTQPADRAARKAMQATPSWGGGEIKAPGSLTHAYSGAAYAGGKIRNDVVRLMSESALEAQRYWTLLHVADKLKAAAKDVPTDLNHDVPVTLEHVPGSPSLAKAKAMLANESTFEPGMAELSHGYEGLRHHIFPDKEEAAHAAMSGEPIPGVKWVDERLLGGLNKPNPLTGLMQHDSFRKAVGIADATNNASKLAILYLKPAYIAPNLMSNLAMNFVQQGFAAPLNLARAARLWAKSDPETINNVLGSMGHGAISSLDTGMGVGAKAVHFAASKFAKPVDVLPRIASFLYEARRDGVTNADELRSLFADPAQADKLDQITRRANLQMVDFGNLTPIERSIIARVVFFYPWVKGSASWLGRFPLEHPVGAGATSQLGQLGEKEQSAALGQYLPSWAEGLIPVGTGAHGLPETVDPFTVTPFDTSAKFLQSIGETLTGHPKLAPNSAADYLTPALAALVHLVSGGAPAVESGLVSNIPEVTLPKQAMGHGSKTYPYEGTPLQAFLRYLAGTGFIPRETDTQTLERSYENERKKSHR